MSCHFPPRRKETAPSELHQAIEKIAQNCLRPDKTPYRSLMLKEEQYLAQSNDVSRKEVQIAALECGVVPERYARNQKSLSNEEQVQLLKSHVAVIGLGGLGGFVAETLARIGVGALTLVDGDHFEESNLNRQLFSSVDDIGNMKADVAARRIKAINPAVDTLPVNRHVTADNGKSIIEHADLAVDCLDDIPARFTLEQVCKKLVIPMVSAAIGGASGQATVIFPEDPGLKNVYGPQDGGGQTGKEASLGTLPFAAMAMAAHECAEVVALAVNRPSQLRNKLLVADITGHSTETVILG